LKAGRRLHPGAFSGRREVKVKWKRTKRTRPAFRGPPEKWAVLLGVIHAHKWVVNPGCSRHIFNWQQKTTKSRRRGEGGNGFKGLFPEVSPKPVFFFCRDSQRLPGKDRWAERGIFRRTCNIYLAAIQILVLSAVPNSNRGKSIQRGCGQEYSQNREFAQGVSAVPRPTNYLG